MHVRKAINDLLRHTGYQIAKTSGSQASLSLVPGQVLDTDLIASRVAATRKHVWIVAPPKSGSTWLTALLDRLLEWPLVPLVNGYDRREQEVDLLSMLRFPDINILSPHQHCRASQPTIDFIKKFRVRPILITRNIFDSMVSFRDHLLNESRAVPMAYVDDRFFELDEDKQYEFVIEMFLPWFLSYYASWFSAEGLAPADRLLVSYEELVADTSKTLHRTLEYIGEARSDSEIQTTIARVQTMDTRKNKAVHGRGAQSLKEHHQERIRDLGRYYSHIDLSMIGL
jgi:hypothetical protein